MRAKRSRRLTNAPGRVSIRDHVSRPVSRTATNDRLLQRPASASRPSRPSRPPLPARPPREGTRGASPRRRRRPTRTRPPPSARRRSRRRRRREGFSPSSTAFFPLRVSVPVPRAAVGVDVPRVQRFTRDDVPDVHRAVRAHDRGVAPPRARERDGLEPGTGRRRVSRAVPGDANDSSAAPPKTAPRCASPRPAVWSSKPTTSRVRDPSRFVIRRESS